MRTGHPVVDNLLKPMRPENMQSPRKGIERAQRDAQAKAGSGEGGGFRHDLPSLKDAMPVATWPRLERYEPSGTFGCSSDLNGGVPSPSPIIRFGRQSGRDLLFRSGCLRNEGAEGLCRIAQEIVAYRPLAIDEAPHSPFINAKAPGKSGRSTAFTMLSEQAVSMRSAGASMRRIRTSAAFPRPERSLFAAGRPESRVRGPPGLHGGQGFCDMALRAQCRIRHQDLAIRRNDIAGPVRHREERQFDFIRGDHRAVGNTDCKFVAAFGDGEPAELVERVMRQADDGGSGCVKPVRGVGKIMGFDGAAAGEGSGEEIEHHRPIAKGLGQTERKRFARQHGLRIEIRRGAPLRQGGQCRGGRPCNGQAGREQGQQREGYPVFEAAGHHLSPLSPMRAGIYRKNRGKAAATALIAQHLPGRIEPIGKVCILTSWPISRRYPAWVPGRWRRVPATRPTAWTASACSGLAIQLHGVNNDSEHDDAADAFALMHEVKGGVDLFEAHDMGDHGVDLDLAGHVHVDDLGHIGAALGPAESGAAPVAAGDKLERTGADFLACFRHADDDAGAPAAMAGFQGGAHDFGVAGGVERVIRAAVGHQHDLGHDILAAHAPRVEEVGHAELAAPFLAGLVDVDTDDLVGAGKARTLNDIEADPAKAEDHDIVAHLHLGRVDHRAHAGRHAAADVAGRLERRVLADLRHGDFGQDGEVREAGRAVGHQALALRRADRGAQVGLAREAAFALAAFGRVERDHMVAGDNTGDARAHFAHDACALMTQNAGEDTFRIKAIERVGIGMANAGCHDLHQNLTGTRAFKINLHDFQRGLGGKGNGGAGLHPSAATALGLSRSHMSRAVADLEDRLQVLLLQRTTRKVRLTASGEVFLDHARRLLSDRDEAIAMMLEKSEPQGDLSITCSTALGERFVAPLARAFAREHPKIRLTLDLSNR
ncbi:S-(hydroxymethyl)glutathione dehydrogenase, partial [Termitomyces sp. T112]